MDREIRREGEGKRQCQQPVPEIRGRDFSHVELGDCLAFVVAEKRERGSEAGAKGRADFRRIRTDDGELAIVDLQVFL